MKTGYREFVSILVIMKTSILACLLSLVLTSVAGASEWKTDFEAAKVQAKKDNRPILLDFTGSDWCGWCIRMKKDSLTKKEFQEYAAKNLVLVEVDFPRKAQPAAQKKANQALKNKYDVEGYPTFVLVSPEGKELGRQVGYVAGGPEAFIAKIEQWRKAGK